MSNYGLYVALKAWTEMTELPGHVRRRARRAVDALARQQGGRCMCVRPTWNQPNTANSYCQQSRNSNLEVAVALVLRSLA